MPAFAPPPFDEAQDTEAPLSPPSWDDAVDAEAPLMPPAWDDAVDADPPDQPTYRGTPDEVAPPVSPAPAVPDYSTSERIFAGIGAQFANSPQALKQLAMYVDHAFYKGVDSLFGSKLSEPYANEINRLQGEMDERTSVGREAAGGGLWADVSTALGQEAVMMPLQLTGAGAATRIGQAGNALRNAVATSAAIGGLRSASGEFASDVAERVRGGASPKDAADSAFVPSVAKGLITAATTSAFGGTGIEAVFKKEGAKGTLNRIFTTLREGGMGVGEEITDESLQMADDLIRGKGVTADEAIRRVTTAAVTASIMGTGVNALHQIVEATASDGAAVQNIQSAATEADSAGATETAAALRQVAAKTQAQGVTGANAQLSENELLPAPKDKPVVPTTPRGTFAAVDKTPLEGNQQAQLDKLNAMLPKPAPELPSAPVEQVKPAAADERTEADAKASAQAVTSTETPASTAEKSPTLPTPTGKEATATAAGEPTPTNEKTESLPALSKSESGVRLPAAQAGQAAPESKPVAQPPTAVEPKTDTPPTTPLQKDWVRLKKEAGDSVVAVRLGDFFEFFNEDAAIVAKAANVALTKRNGVRMAGVPYHAVDKAIADINAAGVSVAIADVTGDAVPGKLIPRSIVEVRGKATAKPTGAESVAAPAAVKDSLTTPAPRSFKTRPPADDFGGPSTPAAQYIEELGGLLSKSAAKKKGLLKDNGELWNGAPTKWASSTHNKVYNPDTGITPDKAATLLFEKGIINEDSVDAMWVALQSESQSAKNNAREQSRQEAEGKLFEKQEKAFNKATAKPGKGKEAIPVTELQPGDTVIVSGESMKVTEIDPDTDDVILEDGTKFGIQVVKDGEVIYGEHQATGERSDDFLPEEETKAPKPAAEQSAAPTVEQSARTPQEIADFADAIKGELVAFAKSKGASDPVNVVGVVMAEAVKDESLATQTDKELRSSLFNKTAKRSIDAFRTERTPEGTSVVPIDEAGEVADAGQRTPDQEAIITDVRNAVADLPEQQRIVVEGILDGKTGEEIGAELGIPKQRVSAIYAEAKVSLKRNMGPGAANIEEPLASYELRSFGERFVEDERIAADIREAAGNRYYEPIPNKVTAEEAKDLVDARGTAESISIIKDEANPLPFHVRSAMGQLVILRLNELYVRLKASGGESARSVLDQAVEMAEWQMDFGTRLGQGVQSFAMWARLSPDGKLASYKKGVDKARQRHKTDTGSDVDEIIDGVNEVAGVDGRTREQRIEDIRRKLKKNETAKKFNKTDWQKLLEAAGKGNLTERDFYESVSDRLGLPSFSTDIAAKITELAAKISGAPEGTPKNEAILELNKFIAAQRGFAPIDLPLGIFYGNILSGYNTHLVNTLDTFFNVVSEINALAMVNPKAAMKIYGGLIRGLNDGKMDALLALTDGRMVTDSKWMDAPRLMEVSKFGEKGGVPIRTKTIGGKAAKTVAESRPAAVLNGWKYVTRMLAASDALMFRGAREARAAVLAYRMAEAEGLSGDAAETRFRQILGLNNMEAFREQARREGLTGARAKARVSELMEMARPDEISADSADFAGEATYNHEPHGTIGMIAMKVGEMSQAVPGLKIFVPFTRIVANVTNRGLNWTPYGFKRAAFGYGFGERTQTLKPEQRQAMLFRATAGTLSLVLLGAAQAAGLLIIHGSGPEDRERRRQLRAAGWKPNSIQLGDNFISYAYAPVGLGLSILGNMSDTQRYGEMGDKDAATIAAYATIRMSSTVFSQSFLSGVSRLFDALSDDTGRSIYAVRSTIANTTAAFTVPNIIKDINRLFDTKAYQSDTIFQDMIRNTPAAALTLRPSINAFGEPIKMDRQRFVSRLTDDKAWRAVIELKVRVPMPGRTTEMPTADGAKRTITPDEYYHLVRVTGPQIKQWILTNQSELEKKTADEAQDDLQEAATKFRKTELSKMRMALGLPESPKTSTRSPSSSFRVGGERIGSF